MSADFHLAQVNIATLLAPLDSPQLAEFVAALDRINAIADASPGFVWRLQDEAGNATSIRPFGEDVIVNLSVWRDTTALFEYVYRSNHASLLARRRDWFALPSTPHVALWWVPAGACPSLVDARARLDHRAVHGDSPFAFSFKCRFAHDGTPIDRATA